MNDQLTGVLRAVIPAIMAYIVGKGWIPAGAAADIGAAIIAVAAAVWSFLTNRDSSIAAKAQALPGVNVQTTPAAAPAVVEAVAVAKTTP